MSQHIEAKPTTYRGVTYRSRLEARWAIFLDHHPLVDLFSYEPRTFTLPSKGWTYQPDFVVKFATDFFGYLEVKPDVPSEEYLHVMSQFLPQLADTGTQGFTLHLCWGSWFNAFPKIYDMVPSVKPTESAVRRGSMSLKEAFWCPRGADKTAQSYRFDLPEKTPKFRRSGTDPNTHYQEWIHRQRKGPQS